jgi:bifunctional N-acetylglucosamine-1-phosphate-uridyltransferase/glucosamine-1-phosphate-acetyltransferase GlmU-like protein
VTKNVPPGALAISRVEQENRDGWVEERKKKKQ